MGNRPRRYVTEFQCRSCHVIKPVKGNFVLYADGALRRLSCYSCQYRNGIRTSLNSKYKAAYGITLDDFERMNEAQGGLCYLCGELPRGRGKNKKLHVDHDHTSGKVRKLICSFCNSGLGYFRDDPTLLVKAIAYLQEHSEEEQS